MKKIAAVMCSITLLLSLVLVAPIPAQDNWRVLCDTRTGEITLTRDLPPPNHIVLQQFFSGEPAARAWVNANYPNWRCK